MNDMEKTLVSESEDFAAMLEETMIKFRPGQVVKGVGILLVVQMGKEECEKLKKYLKRQ